MKTLHTIVITLIAILIPTTLPAQLKNLDKRIENKVKRRVDQKTDRTIDKTLDKTEREIDKGVNEATTPEKEPNTSAQSKVKKNEPDSPARADNEHVITPISNESSDFVPGERVLFEDSFEKDALRDFPAAWNTNGSGEIVELGGMPGKWLLIPHSTITYPENMNTLPENFTLEFDLVLPKPDRSPVQFGFSENKNPVKEGIRSKKTLQFQIHHSQDQIQSSNTYYFGSGNSKPLAISSRFLGKSMHIAMSINKTRIRLYVDGEKIFDLPKAFEPASIRNSFFFRAGEIIPEKKGFYISNLRIAESGTDARSSIVKELMEKGNVSTNEIQFDFNSDRIRPASDATINSIGEALKQHPELRIKIVGHTDNVGKLEYNKQLSAKRAEAVKLHLTTHFGIDDDRIKTEGRGSTTPADSNDTEEGRARNRRVEFVKL